MKLEFAQRAAKELVAELEPHCHRIQVAGSIRCREPEVKDIEIVCVPRTSRNLFGEMDLEQPHAVRRRLEEFGVRPRHNVNGHHIGWGQRFLAGELEGVAIDVFCVLPPAQWGCILAIRTGPAQYSRHLVTIAKRRKTPCVDGRLVRSAGGEILTPEEEDFFAALGLDWVAPEDRRSP